MGQYRSAVITDAGQALLADAISGSGTVTFSAVKTSSYAYPQGINIAGLTDLQDIVQTVTPFSVQVFNDTMLQVSTRFDNSDVTSAYLIQTIGAYAQIGDNDPVLFAVVQANTPDQMPVQSSVSPSAFIYNIQITVQQASQITVTVNPAGTATVQDILTLSTQKVDVNGGELSETETSFDDSGSVSEITSFPAFLATFLSKTKTGIFLRNLKAGLQFVLHVGSIVNNCVTDNAELPLSAAQGKVLMDLYTVLNTKAQNIENALGPIETVCNKIFYNHSSETVQVPMGLYLLSIAQGGVWTLWGAAIISVSAVIGNSGIMKFAGGSGFLDNNSIKITTSHSPTSITVENATDADIGLSIIKICNR